MMLNTSTAMSLLRHGTGSRIGLALFACLVSAVAVWASALPTRSYTAEQFLEAGVDVVLNTEAGKDCRHMKYDRKAGVLKEVGGCFAPAPVQPAPSYVEAIRNGFVSR